MFFFNNKKKKSSLPTRNFTAGFTLIEILASLIVIMIISLIARTGRSQFENSIYLSNLAYDVALAVREAQVYGTNVRQTGTSCTGSACFELGYGVRFSESMPTSFILFGDRNNDHFYISTMPTPTNCGVINTNDCVVRTYMTKGGNTISDLCVVYATNLSTCAPLAGSNTLDVTFRRPDSEACISLNAVPSVNRASPACVFYTGIVEARITLTAQNGNTKEVRVYSNGQISVP